MNYLHRYDSKGPRDHSEGPLSTAEMHVYIFCMSNSLKRKTYIPLHLIYSVMYYEKSRKFKLRFVIIS